MRLETYLSTQPPAPSKNARLSHSYENSGGAQCVAAPPSEEPSSPDSLKSSFDLSSFPQDFSAATPKRVSAGLRRRAAPQRVTMHRLLPAQRVTPFTLGDYHAGAVGERCPAQSPAAASARSVPAESSEPSGRLGHPGQSPRGSGESLLRGASAGIVADVSPAAAEVGDRLQVTGNGKSINQRPVPYNLSPVTFTGIVKLFALGLIRFYQACLSPVLPSACRHYPSCSAYAFEAVEKWGVGKGVRLALGRVLRCRPWGSYGYDPVPEREGVRSEKLEADRNAVGL